MIIDKKDPYINPKNFGATKSKPFTYSCPNCNTMSLDDDYIIDEVKYPIIINEHIGGDMDGSYHDWDEIHLCKCGKKFWFKNGIY